MLYTIGKLSNHVTTCCALSYTIDILDPKLAPEVFSVVSPLCYVFSPQIKVFHVTFVWKGCIIIERPKLNSMLNPIYVYLSSF